jgi:hypothetical protein
MSLDDELTLEEYKNCRQQILEDIKWMDQLEIYTFGAVAAVFVFIFTQKEPVLTKALIVIPFVISVVGAMRTWALDKTIFVLNNYLQDVEKRHPVIGYTQYYRDNRSQIMKNSRIFVWGVLPVFTFVLALVVWCSGPFWIKAA